MNDEAERLFAQGRAAVQPPAGARERVLARVMAAPPPAGGSGAALGAKIAVGALAVAGVVAAFVALTRPRPAAPVAPRASAPVVASAEPPAPVAEPPVVDSVTPPPVAYAPAPRRAAPRASGGDLAEDVALLREAQAALRGGDAARALALLDAHAKRYPRSAFVQERLATQIQALCKSGRAQEASALYARLRATDPGSPHIAAVRRSCPELEP
jgi:hypothetical protein